MRVLYIALIISIGWAIYKMVGEIKYGNAVERYGKMEYDNPKLDSCEKATTKLDPGNFFSLNP